MELIECVPNISEGRRADVIADCADAVRRAGADILDVSSDADHHRSVLTFVGEADALERAVLALFDVAIHRIDLRGHTGVHPRIGAVDVTPFVPLGGSSLDACAALARRVGAQVAARFDVPVFLYEAAASKPGRAGLADIRRGQTAGVSTRMADGSWLPDFGPSHLHPTAGAAVIGARNPLIAFNVNLASTDVGVAKRIASIVRERDGGLPGVRALGVRLTDRGLVQVTTNVTDYRRTSLADLFARIVAEADRLGIEVVESEIVGLVPAAALTAVAARSLRLDQPPDPRVLEYRLARPPGWLA